jgi:hypothetical protein
VLFHLRAVCMLSMCPVLAAEGAFSFPPKHRAESVKVWHMLHKHMSHFASCPYAAHAASVVMLVSAVLLH